DGDGAAVVVDAGEAAARQAGELDPVAGVARLRVAAEDRVDEDALRLRPVRRLLEADDLVLRGRLVAAHENQLERVLVVGPLELLGGVTADAGDVLQAAADLEGEELLVEAVEVGGQVKVLAHP